MQYVQLCLQSDCDILPVLAELVFQFNPPDFDVFLCVFFFFFGGGGGLLFLFYILYIIM